MTGHPTDPFFDRNALPTAGIVTLEGTDPDASGGVRVPTLVRVWSPESTVAERIALNAPLLQLGRAVTGPDDVHIVGDARVSRRHARLHTGEMILEDLSAHGTYVNGEKVERAELRDGDLVRMGDTFFVVRWSPVREQDAEIDEFLGVAPSVRYLRAQIDLIGPSAAWVLLLGETGSGKEVSARALHARSGRSGPFVAVNCSAIPESLAESQLFGHKKGAFTGADRDYAGFFEQADGGTLFLDELGELSATLQPKLLRALDERSVTRVGDMEPRSVDVRVVAATNRDLGTAMQSGDFRGDLYARLADITLRLPALRERREDVVTLLMHAIELPDPRLSPELVELLLLHDWPHNVRELMKVATELTVRGQGERVLGRRLVADRFDLGNVNTGPLHAPIAAADDDGPTLRRAAPGSGEAKPRAPDREALVLLLWKHSGNVTELAEALGKSRRQVYRWLEKFELDVDDYR